MTQFDYKSLVDSLQSTSKEVEEYKDYKKSPLLYRISSRLLFIQPQFSELLASMRFRSTPIDLPPEVIVHIISFLPNEQVVALRRLNKFFYRALTSNDIWKDRYFQFIENESSYSMSMKSNLLSCHIGFDFYFQRYFYEESKTFYDLEENRRQRIESFTRAMGYGGSLTEGELYPIPVYNTFGNISDVYYASKKHVYGVCVLLIPFLLRVYSKRWSYLSNILVFVSRYFTYDLYYDAKCRWRRKGVYNRLKSMTLLSCMGLLLSHYSWSKEEDMFFENPMKSVITETIIERVFRILMPNI